MVRGVASVLEKHHRVQVLDEALEAAVRLSHRYIPARQLPDKAVSLLDTACARVAISQHAVPAELEDCRDDRGAADRARDHRPRGGGRRRTSPSARARARSSRRRSAARRARSALAGGEGAGRSHPGDRGRKLREGQRAGREGEPSQRAEQAAWRAQAAVRRKRRADRRRPRGERVARCSPSWASCTS